MKSILTTLAAVLIAATTFADGGKYRIDDAQMEAQFEQATELEWVFDQQQLEAVAAENGVDVADVLAIRNDKNQMIAGAIAAGEIVLGLAGIPIHRIYLGTSTGTIVGYILTWGGCGIITFVDAIVLLVNGDGDKYIDNTKFFMW